MSKKTLLFSVTGRDCDFDYFRGTGAGGQKRNKTSSGVRCTHRASGAVGKSDDTRSQHQNKPIAFIHMSETKEFRAWHKMEIARRMGILQQINENVERAMQERNLRTEVRIDGIWTEAQIAEETGV